MDRKKPLRDLFQKSWFGLNKKTTIEAIEKLTDHLSDIQLNAALEKKINDAEVTALDIKVQELTEEINQKYLRVGSYIHLKNNLKYRAFWAKYGLYEEDAKLESLTSIPVVRLKLGDRLIADGLLTQEQLGLVFEQQQKVGGRLGDIIIEMGYMSKKQMEQIASNQPGHGRLGDMLVDSGEITQDQLNKAIEFQQKSGGVLGDVLLALRFIAPEKLYRIIATQSSLGRVGSEFSFENTRKLPEQLARKYDAIVINEDSNRYLVAVSAPLSEEATQEIETYLGMPIELVLATRDELEFFWKSVYEEELMLESTQKLVEEQPQNSAHITFTKPQITIIGAMALLFIVCLIWSWLVTLIVVNLIVQVFYFVMTLFKFITILYGTRDKAQLRFTPEEIDAIDEKKLPVYTILVPMYKEGRVIPQLLQNLERLDYPKSKLDVRLLIEQDDIEAQEILHNMDLPAYYTTIVVPHSLPKTKPKACNYGLIRARGEYVVIFDAEDRPDPDQLKKVYAAFLRSPSNCACIQAKLNYFNSNQNLLTRWFTQEYSMWFELLLPGIMQLNIPIPLGGTSNHFKMSVLREVNAWDPYNVTEDADLGIRLYKSGYTTAIVDSRTWEEANSQVGNWIRQRSRWIKGYMQTWLVHMRNPYRLWKELGTKGFLGFQLMVLATPLIPLLNPLFWVMIILWYGWKATIIKQFFPGFIYYSASWEFYAGNFLFVFSNIVGIYWVIHQLEQKKETVFSYRLVKYALLTPFYWVLMSIAAVKAAWQLVTKPFYWEKTTHGLSKPHHENGNGTGKFVDHGGL
ncbi:glycosyltransferase [Paenibacillus psychroresistens]|uniref:Glycosyltransferase n=1 Tax=Paenibacillus psychroresistens TaxID=1778678 RepID=A0A6B8RM19_9BACL|nr:glycosyltransferase family 2 protein [Paenibacillus psychroresistens]QGQ96794.1 glycosyltransferase [Paenibacillus psychroresistens]